MASVQGGSRIGGGRVDSLGCTKGRSSWANEGQVLIDFYQDPSGYSVENTLKGCGGIVKSHNTAPGLQKCAAVVKN